MTASNGLSVGTRILSLQGEQGYMEDDCEGHTGPNAVGVVVGEGPDQDYLVHFPLGISGYLRDDELADASMYKILTEGEQP